jgi:hypothetical protein
MTASNASGESVSGLLDATAGALPIALPSSGDDAMLVHAPTRPNSPDAGVPSLALCADDRVNAYPGALLLFNGVEATTLKVAPAAFPSVATYVVGVDAIGRAVVIPNVSAVVTMLIERVGRIEADLARRPKPRVRASRAKTTAPTFGKTTL